MVHTLNMVQLSVVPDPDAERPLGVRERNRLDRHRRYLAAALQVISAEGLEALTMQRLASEVGASVGSVYTYFPSKGALVAEVQREAIERLASSVLVLGNEIDLATPTGESVSLLAPVVGFGRFWLTASGPYPEEMQLLLLLLSDVTDAVPEEDGARVLPAVLRLLGLVDERLDAAAAGGALGPGAADRRTIALAAALTGCLQLDSVRHWDPDLLDPLLAGRTVLDALLLGWDADPDALAGAHRIVDDLEAHGPLARPLTGARS